MFDAKRFRRGMYILGGDDGGAGVGGGGSGGGDPAAGAGSGGVGGNGSAAGNYDFKAFVGTLDEGLRNEPTIQQIQDFPTLVKNYVNAEKLIGSKRIALPGENATPEEINAFYNALGRPESPDNYGIKFKDEFKYGDDNTLKWAKGAFHKVGLSDKGAQTLLDDYADFVADQKNQFDNDLKMTRAETETTLRREFGLAYEQKLNIGDTFLTQFATPELIDVFKNSGLVYSPDFIRFCAAAGGKIVEDQNIGGSGGVGALTPDQAKGKIAELLGDSEFQKQYTDKMNPAHKAAVEKMADLFRYAHPDEVAG